MSEEKGIIGKITSAVSGAGDYLKSAFGVAKEIQEMHVDYSVKIKTEELLSKLLDARSQQMNLQDLLISAKDRIIELDNLIKQKEDWAVEESKYKLLKTEAGSFVYTTIESSDDDQDSPYFCPHCYSKKEISLLHPSTGNTSKSGFYLYQCHNCNSEFKMNRTPFHGGATPNPLMPTKRY
ncbi:hypothetical protein O9569_05370 [Proteus mirabilis]|uniref:hypothetical protein n=1 Tax=Proteus mirabilis TaxID=584 RepID=UPI0025776FF3|nr:hypothetical protein [Proteus mirabilis]MDM3818897.1 hypothetical protein [Proteus mirabilis]